MPSAREERSSLEDAGAAGTGLLFGRIGSISPSAGQHWRAGETVTSTTDGEGKTSRIRYTAKEGALSGSVTGERTDWPAGEVRELPAFRARLLLQRFPGVFRLVEGTHGGIAALGVDCGLCGEERAVCSSLVDPGEPRCLKCRGDEKDADRERNRAAGLCGCGKLRREGLTPQGKPYVYCHDCCASANARQRRRRRKLQAKKPPKPKSLNPSTVERNGRRERAKMRDQEARWRRPQMVRVYGDHL